MPRPHQHVRHHAHEILRLQQGASPWGWMAVTGASTLVPLACGVARGEGAAAIFGALTGYFMGLTDHPGHLAHRLLMATTTLVICWLAFAVGIALQPTTLGFAAVSAVMVYLVGILGGRGAEFERLLLLAGINGFVSRYAPSVSFAVLPGLSLYFGLAWIAAVGTVALSHFTLQRRSAEYVTLRASLNHFFTREPERHYYALTYTCAIVLTILVVDHYEIDRGYWTVVTVLLMMNPARKVTMYRIAQRIVGTLLGVGIGHLLVHAEAPIALYVGSAGLCATLVPYFWKRNYWLVSFCATVMVISLLSVAQYGRIDPTITILRIKATLVGCLLASAVSGAFGLAEGALLRKRRPTI